MGMLLDYSGDELPEEREEREERLARYQAAQDWIAEGYADSDREPLR